MVVNMDENDRATIKISRELFTRIKRITEKEDLGFNSPTDFIKDAIREKLKEVDPEGSKYYDDDEK